MEARTMEYKNSEGTFLFFKAKYISLLLWLSVLLGSFIIFQCHNSQANSGVRSRTLESTQGEKQNFKIPLAIITTHLLDEGRSLCSRERNENFQNTLRQYPGMSAVFLDSNACKLHIRQAEPRLLDYFDSERTVENRREICRIAALYNDGGYYFDVDVQALQRFRPSEETTFVAAMACGGRCFSKSFLGSIPRHALLKRTLESVLVVYENSNSAVLGQVAMANAYGSMPSSERNGIDVLGLLGLGNVERPEHYPLFEPSHGMAEGCNHVLHDGIREEALFLTIYRGIGGCVSPTHELQNGLSSNKTFLTIQRDAKPICLNGDFYGQHSNRILSVARALQRAHEKGTYLALMGKWNPWYKEWFEPRLDVKLHHGAIENCEELLDGIKAYALYGVYAHTPTLIDLVPSKSIRDEAERTFRGPFISVHRRMMDGWCKDLVGMIAERSGKEQGSYDNTCNYSYKDFSAFEEPVVLFTDGQEPDLDRTFPNIDMHDFRVQMWAMTLSKVHFGVPASTVDEVVSHWRKFKEIEPADVFRKDRTTYSLMGTSTV